MQIVVKGKQIDVGDSLREHVEQNVSDVVRKYFHQPIEGTVIFSKDASFFKTEIIIHASSKISLQSSAEAADIYPSFDLALEKITARLRRYKNKLRDNHHKTHKEEAISNQYVIDTNNQTDTMVADSDTESMIIAEMEHRVETMTVSEAVMRMDLGKHVAYMFRNAAHGDLNMVYRRLDGNVGWVDPKGNEQVMAGAKS